MTQRISFLLAGTLACASTVGAQRARPMEPPAGTGVRFMVVVLTESGRPVTDLLRQDFKVWDAGVERPITGFRVIPEGVGAVEISLPGGNASAGGRRGDGERPDGSGGRPGRLPWYEITFEGAIAAGPEEFHTVGIGVDRPYLKVMARSGYYAKSR